MDKKRIYDLNKPGKGSFSMGAPDDPSLGDMIRGYQLEKRLGAGKLMTLYRARTEELWLPSELAIMLVHTPESLSMRARARFAERFTCEASRLIKLRHPSLHPLLGYGEETGHRYLLFPLPAPSTTLGQRLNRPWSPSEAFAVLTPLSSIFDYLHQQNVVYRFFTPGNVLLPQHAAPQITGTGILQLLLLQGLDDEVGSDEPHRHLKNLAGDYICPLTYVAPEVIRGEQPDARSDIYSLGILLFELLSGQPPFTGARPMDVAQKHLREPLPSLREVAPTVPVALELVINRALHRNPDHRFATAGELITAFSHVLNERLRSPAYLSREQRGAKKQTDPLPVPAHERLFASIEASEEILLPQTYDDLPIYPAEKETCIATTSTAERELLIAETLTSREHSMPENIQKMAQHIQVLREHIQGECKR